MIIHWRSIIFMMVFLWLSEQIFGLQPYQSIKGKVFDKSSLNTLHGATVVIPGTTPLRGTVTDSTGAFILKQILPGKYTLKISFLGYQPQIIEDIVLIAGKEQVVEVGLTQKLDTLQEVTITARNKNLHDPLTIDYLSTRSITVEQTQRYAATFYDPTRVIMTGSGVVAANDQANHIIVRGNNPFGLLWRIEGVDVVNPNHLTNAGLPSDKPSLTGGGVTILSTQLMAGSRFLNGAFPAGYGNVLAGVFDITLREGNNGHYEFTGQISLLGIDLAAEGPLPYSRNGSFVLNYRYSTLGVFSAAGIPIGDETINFQDLSFKFSLPTAKTGKFTIFGIGGKSITRFEAERDSLAWEYKKDRTDVDFFSDMGVIGFKHTLTTDFNSALNTAVAISGLKSGREEDYITGDYTERFNQRDDLSLIKKSVSSWYYKKVNNHLLVKTGVVLNYNTLRINSTLASGANQPYMPLNDGKTDYVLFQPYAHTQYLPSDRLEINTGLHFIYSDFNHDLYAEPRLSFRFRYNTNNFMSMGYGLHSQMQHPSVYFNQVQQNTNLGLTRAHHFVAGLTNQLSKDLTLISEAYYQFLFDVPVSVGRGDSFSALNIMETTNIAKELVNNGTGRNYGLDMSLERTMSDGLYLVAAGSIYNSLYKGSDGILRDTRFNGNYSAKFTSGKEFDVIRESSLHTWGVNVSITQSGGMRYTPLITTNSSPGNEVLSDTNRAYSKQMNDFFRMDIRFLWKKNVSHYTRTIALDIQNATNTKNPAWMYYDDVQKEVVMKNQLGIIPFLSYKIEF